MKFDYRSFVFIFVNDFRKERRKFVFDFGFRLLDFRILGLGSWFLILASWVFDASHDENLNSRNLGFLLYFTTFFIF